jgi:hypothetical protein
MITRLLFLLLLSFPFSLFGNSTLFNQLSAGANYAELRLELDLKAFLEGSDVADYQSATLHLMNGRKVTDTYTIKVRTRGKFRLKTCDFPPLKLKFKKKDLAERGLQPFNDLKLITHCSDESEVYEDRLFREYLAYKLYNRITPESFRVQLVRITYVDQYNHRNRIKRWAFVLEDIEELAARLGGTPFEGFGITQKDMVPGADARVAGFEYLISNTDWDMVGQRNVKFVQRTDGLLIPIPYDFDFSGFVLAPYAVPRSDLGQRNVRHRVYQGELREPSELKAMSEVFFERREVLLQEIQRFPYLGSDSRYDLYEFTESFYREEIGSLFRRIAQEYTMGNGVSK